MPACWWALHVLHSDLKTVKWNLFQVIIITHSNLGLYRIFKFGARCNTDLARFRKCIFIEIHKFKCISTLFWWVTPASKFNIMLTRVTCRAEANRCFADASKVFDHRTLKKNIFVTFICRIKCKKYLVCLNQLFQCELYLKSPPNL